MKLKDVYAVCSTPIYVNSENPDIEGDTPEELNEREVEDIEPRIHHVDIKDGYDTLYELYLEVMVS